MRNSAHVYVRAGPVLAAGDVAVVVAAVVVATLDITLSGITPRGFRPATTPSGVRLLAVLAPFGYRLPPTSDIEIIVR